MAIPHNTISSDLRKRDLLIAIEQEYGHSIALAPSTATGVPLFLGMSLQITQREREGMVILDLNGPLILGRQNADFQKALQVLAESGETHLALNMEKVGRIDSTGIGTLVVAFMRLRKAGGRLALFNLSPSHTNLLLLTKLVTVFEVFADEQGAMNSFFPGRAIQGYDVLNLVQQPQNSEFFIPSAAGHPTAGGR